MVVAMLKLFNWRLKFNSERYKIIIREPFSWLSQGFFNFNFKDEFGQEMMALVYTLRILEDKFLNLVADFHEGVSFEIGDFSKVLQIVAFHLRIEIQLIFYQVILFGEI